MTWDDTKTAGSELTATEYNAMVADQKIRGSGYTAVVGKLLPCDYLTTDYASDDAAIQAAITAFTALGGGALFLKAGSYSIENKINIDSNILFSGAGNNTILTMTNSADVNMLAVESENNVVIQNLKIDGNKSNNTAGSGVLFNNVSNGVIRNLTIQNAPLHSIGISGASGVSQYCRIESNYLTGCGHRNILCDPQVKYSMISNNTCLSAGLANILVGHGSSYINVIGNYCSTTTTADGIILHHDVQHCRVIGNTSTLSAGSGILLDKSVRNNIITNNSCISNTENGIRINAGMTDATYGYMTEADSERNIISGNVCNENTESGIYLSYEADGKIVKRSVISDNIAIVNGAYGINETAGQNQNYISNNQVAGNTSGQIIINGSTTWAINNPGFNPVSNFTAPALPASANTYTNAYGYPCMVSVYGGTVTEIMLDGVVTGQTSGIFTIAQEGTIKITYSVAPTWVWWGL